MRRTKKTGIRNLRKGWMILAAFLVLLYTGGSLPVQAQERVPFRYAHDPMENPKAAEDIVVNEAAVYGYSPNPASVRLKEFADAIDWTDEAQVAQARAERAEYHAKNEELYSLAARMMGEGRTIEETARAVSGRRNEIRLESYAGDPEGLARVKKSNLDTYGSEEGPSADSLYEKYGSWQTVLEKALSTNPGMDACLGFYDQYYELYDIAEAEGGALIYEVAPGDSLWKISYRFYQDGRLWEKIYQENAETISVPRKIHPGQQLRIPDAA